MYLTCRRVHGNKAHLALKEDEALKDLLKRNIRACIGGLRPSPEVEAFVPVRSPNTNLAFRRCLKDLGVNPASTQRRGMLNSCASDFTWRNPKLGAIATTH